MLDRYVWGDAERVSQEAPVIVLRADRREERLGGAGSVAMMLRALGAEQIEDRKPPDGGKPEHVFILRPDRLSQG